MLPERLGLTCPDARLRRLVRWPQRPQRLCSESWQVHALLLVSEIRTVAADNLLMSGYAAASRPAARAWPRYCGKGARQLQCRSQRAGEAHPHACILCADLKQTHKHPYTRARAHTHEHIPSFTRGSKSPTHTWPPPSDKYDPSGSNGRRSTGADAAFAVRRCFPWRPRMLQSNLSGRGLAGRCFGRDTVCIHFTWKKDDAVYDPHPLARSVAVG